MTGNAQRLGQPPFSRNCHVGTVSSPFGSSFDTKTAALALDQKVQDLASHINDDDREARELETALGQRDRAAATRSNSYQGTATALEGLYRQAGFKDLADKVRPTQRKLRGEDAGAELDTPSTNESPTGG